MANRVKSFNFVGLHEDEFEELAFLAAHMEIEGLVKTANPDGGLDGVVLGIDGTPAPRGIQAKRFTGAPSWPQCIASLDAAVENYRVRHLTFIFARDLTKGQIEKFQDKLCTRHEGVRVDFWAAGQLTGKLLGSEQGKTIATHIFGEEDYKKLQRAIAAQRELDTTGQAIEALGAVGETFSDDPYFKYGVGSRPAELPGAPADGATIRLEIHDGESTKSIDAYATQAAIDAGRMPQAHFRITDEAAMKSFQEFLRKGGKLALDGVEMEVENAPKHMEELLGEAAAGHFEFESPPRVREIDFEVETDAGKAEAKIEISPTPALEGWEHSFQGERDGLTLTVAMRETPSGGEVNMNWHWSMADSRPTAERLAALRMMEALSGEGEVRLLDPESGGTIVAGPSPQGPFHEELATLKQVYEDIGALEGWLGEAIGIPAEINSKEAQALRRVAKLIEGWETDWTDASVTMRPGGDTERLKAGGQLKVAETLSMRLFGKVYELGQEVTTIDEYRIAETIPAEDGGTKFVFRPPDSDSRILKRLERIEN